MRTRPTGAGTHRPRRPVVAAVAALTAALVGAAALVPGTASAPTAAPGDEPRPAAVAQPLVPGGTRAGTPVGDGSASVEQAAVEPAVEPATGPAAVHDGHAGTDHAEIDHAEIEHADVEHADHGPSSPVDHAEAGGARPARPADLPASSAPASSEAAPSEAAPSAPTPSAPTPTPSSPTGTRPVPLAPGVVTGTLTRLWAEEFVAEGEDHDHATDGGKTLQVWVETPARAYQVPPAAVTGIEDGSTVTVELAAPRAVHGTHPVLAVQQVAPAVQAADAVVFGEGSTDVFGAAAATVMHDVTVALAVPKGYSADATTASQVATTVTTGVHPFWHQQSRGQRGFRVVASHSWTSLSSTCADPFKLWDEVAAKVGFVSGPRKHLLVFLPKAAGCGAGLGTVGTGPDSGGRSWVSSNTVSIISHELGHNLGLGHSDGLLCSGRADGSWSAGTWQSGCAVHGYRDYYDVMGISWAHLGSLAAPHADALGLLLSTEKLVTAEPVRVHLVPATSDGLRVLRVDDPSGAYYVEYRVPTGRDAWLGDNYRGLDAGVVVHRRAPDDARKALLLDGSVTSGTRTDDWRSALPVGASLTTTSGRTRIHVEQQSSTGATLVVYRDGVGPGAVVAPADGAQVQIRTPLTASTASAGTVVFSGVATAPEGTLLWEVRQDGVRKASGSTTTGANGEFDTFQVPVSLPAGTFTFRVQVPDDSDGESVVDPSLLVDETSIALR